jgi:5-(aminomethyl)-3-furanmethanol phosphate kinase
MNVTVVKVGGSLASYPEKLRALCTKLNELSKTHKLIVIPGGGEFADVVRCMDEVFSLSCSTSHRMAILAMDQYGLLLSDLMPNSATVCKLEEVKYFLDSDKLPVFLPSSLLLSEDPLENTWDVTSDSIAVYLAGRLQADKVLLVTDVDGVYKSDPKTNSEAKLIENISTGDLLAMNERTSVDKALPKLLLALHVECFVVNGLFPARIEAVLAGQDTIRTLIR